MVIRMGEMPYQFPGYQRNSDSTYGPTANGKFYLAVPYHNRNASLNPMKSRWCLDEDQQYEVFRVAEEADVFYQVNKALIGLLCDCTVILGMNSERLSKFPCPTNSTDAWHGFPIRSNEIDLDEGLLDRLVSAGIISRITRSRIVRGKI